MEFEPIEELNQSDFTSIDIKQVFVATNATQQVYLIENTLGNWEIWVDGVYVDQWGDRETAIRNVECKVAFRMKIGEIICSSEG